MNTRAEVGNQKKTGDGLLLFEIDRTMNPGILTSFSFRSMRTRSPQGVWSSRFSSSSSSGRRSLQLSVSISLNAECEKRTK